MYNSTNLPLDRKKIIKKTIQNSVWMVIGLILGVVIVVIGLIAEHGIIFYILGTLVFLLPIFGTYLYQFYYYKLYFYDFGDVSAEIRKGVIARSTGHVQYSRIQNVYIDQDVLDRIFGLYDIHYETAGETSGIYSHVDGLNKENGEKLVAFLNSKLKLTPKVQPEVVKPLKMEESSATVSTSGEVMNASNTPLSKKYLLTTVLSGRFFYGLGALIFYGFISFIGADENESIDFNTVLTILPYVVIVLLLILVFFFIYNYVWFKNFYFEFNDTSGVLKTKVVAQSQTFIYYDRVQNINIKQGAFDRLLGIAQVIIETAAGNGGSSQLVIPGLPYSAAEKLKDFLLDRVKLYRNTSRLGL